MTASARRLITLLIVGVAALAVCASVRHADLTAEVAAARADAVVIELRLIEARAVHDDLAATADELAQTRSDLADAAAVRPEFLASVAAFAAAEQQAAGKVDAAAARAEVLAQQESVLAARDDADVVRAAGQAVSAQTASLTEAIAAVYAERARVAALRASAAAALSAGASGSAATLSGYDRVRAALDRVGGAHVPVQEYAGSCSGVTSDACAMRSGVILYTPAVTGWSDGRLHWAMAHELAHIHQFAVWSAMTASPGYGRLFGGDPELLANCMAQQRGFGGGGSCSGEQLSWAAGIWVGSVQG